MALDVVRMQCRHVRPARRAYNTGVLSCANRLPRPAFLSSIDGHTTHRREHAKTFVNLDRAFERWRALLGASAVLPPAQAQTKYSGCTTGTSRRIAGALRPSDRDAVIAAMRIAHEEQVPVHPISTGHNWGYGSANPVTDDCVLLDLSAMRRVLAFDAEFGVITIEPGVTQGDLAQFLRDGGHDYLVPVTGAGPSCSVLANALERGYGVTPHADHFSAVTAIEAVLADGRAYRSALSTMGAQRIDRLFKWGIGPYVDGLFAQSGCAIVTSISIALARRPQAIAAGFFGLRDAARLPELVGAVRSILTRHPGIIGGINLMNRHRVLSMSITYPAERIGADGVIEDAAIEALGRAQHTPAWTGFVTVYGTPGVVRAAKRAIRRTVRAVAGEPLFFSPKAAARLDRFAGRFPALVPAGLRTKVGVLAKTLQLVDGWPNETAMPLAYWRSGRPMPRDGTPADPAQDRCGLIWYAPLVPMSGTVAAEFVAMVHRITPQFGIEPLITLTSLSDRVFDSTVPLVFDLDSPDQTRAAHACFDALLEAGKALGCLPYRVGIDQMRWLTEHPGTYWEVVGALKSALDPRDLIAPGRYAPRGRACDASAPASKPID